MSTVGESTQRLRELVYEYRKHNTFNVCDAEIVLGQLLKESFSDDGRRLQITSGVVLDVAQLLLVWLHVPWSSVYSRTSSAESSNILRQIAKLLTNLTFGAPECKRLLCTHNNFISSVAQLIENRPDLVRDYSDLLRNISWNCDKEICQELTKTVFPLASASVHIHRLGNDPSFCGSRSSSSSSVSTDKTLKAVYSVLWNLALISFRCREKMCSVNDFLHYLIAHLDDLDSQISLIETVVGLSKCLVDQIYKFSNASLRESYINGLMNLVAGQAAHPNIALTRNLIQALSLCIRHQNDEITNRIFHTKNRFRYDLHQLLKKQELDQQTRDRIQALLRHVSYCSGLYKGIAAASPSLTPSYLQSPMYSHAPTLYTPAMSLGPTTRPNMPLTSLLSSVPSSIQGTTFRRNHQPHSLITQNSNDLTPTSLDSELPSSSDSKAGVSSRRNEDLKSSGYSETSMGSENFLPSQYITNPRYHIANEYAEPKKQAFIRNLPPTVNQLRQHSLWTSPNNMNNISGLYENHLVIAKSLSDSLSASTSHTHDSSDQMSSRAQESSLKSHNHYQNEDDVEGEEGARESFYSGMEPNRYGSQESLYCNARSQHPSMTSIATMPYYNEEYSPKSANLSPVNEDDLDEYDSASQRGVLIEKNASTNTTPHPSMTTSSTISDKQKLGETTPLKQNLLNLPKLELKSPEDGFNVTV